jgi:septal ring-binding cell division protein DamX
MRRDSPRRLVLAAGIGLAAGVALGFLGAKLLTPVEPPASSVLAASPRANPVVAPASAAAAPAPTSVAAPASAPTAKAVPVAAKASVAPKEEPPRSSVEARLAAGSNAPLGAHPSRYSVQLLTADAREREYLENYLAEAGRAVQHDQLYIVPSGSAEAPRMGVIFGSFDDRGKANAALASLPDNLRQFRPYVRPLDGVREEARKSQQP